MTLLKRLILLSLLLTFVFPYQAFAYKVVLDAGHGGSDPGAIGVNGLREKDVNWDITQKVRDELIAKGYEVVLTRTDDSYWSLAQRVEFTNTLQADLFVSIHANAHPSAKANGTMVLYYDNDYPQEDYPASEAMKQLTPYNKDLAQRVLDSLVAAVGTKNLGLIPSAVYVARMGTIPSILVETAFLSQTSDAALLASDSVRSKMASGIANGIAAYTPPLFTDSLGHWARDAILRMKNKGVIEGIANRYEPERALTRAEFLTLMDRVFTFSKLKAVCEPSGTVTAIVYGCQAPAEQNYKDLPSSHWASPVFAKAKNLNLLQGYSDGTIRPNQSITRGEVAFLFDRLLQMSSTTTNNPPVAASSASFNDVPETLWSAKAIYALRNKGIIDGITDTAFKPSQTLTRAEIAALLNRYYK
ncbi:MULTISPECIES: N-acetylmuramoyl-L-alanine amidase [unclassified Paenibacillus]|uniref:N-acetylmuramoyl-L-alanine amidase n=1 Tax=unclassified Paenibacillus TaxID=185978 RepID=UPI0027856D5A|nr:MULTISPECIES: N-acetylmuramoyl-L-alanine amidase [unclassified Paenibacillus]MDQ0901467.1 N-acetylmuramoyl-L-alanine amidase [Paenibacillus sp. V4I7]MDQ0920031.1 N-acetylmuramoyl-L-alanine amidase [Paenibacillus sp. V4I5]